jgi:hypothetical protein
VAKHYPGFCQKLSTTSLLFSSLKLYSTVFVMKCVENHDRRKLRHCKTIFQCPVFCSIDMPSSHRRPKLEAKINSILSIKIHHSIYNVRLSGFSTILAKV